MTKANTTKLFKRFKADFDVIKSTASPLDREVIDQIAGLILSGKSTDSLVKFIKDSKIKEQMKQFCSLFDPYTPPKSIKGKSKKKTVAEEMYPDENFNEILSRLIGKIKAEVDTMTKEECIRVIDSIEKKGLFINTLELEDRKKDLFEAQELITNLYAKLDEWHEAYGHDTPPNWDNQIPIPKRTKDKKIDIQKVDYYIEYLERNMDKIFEGFNTYIYHNPTTETTKFLNQFFTLYMKPMRHISHFAFQNWRDFYQELK